MGLLGNSKLPESWDNEFDVVVLGSGGAGLTAALTAATLGASVAVYEKSPTIGGTTAVSGGVVWVPAHRRIPDLPLPVEAAIEYLQSQSLGVMDDELIKTFVTTAEHMVEFVEAHSDVSFEVAEGYCDYKPELPGGRSSGRSLSPRPFELEKLGDWAGRITAFPVDWSNVGLDAETRARLHPDLDPTSDVCIGGKALVSGLLRGILDAGVTPETECRAVELFTDGTRVVGVRIETPSGDIAVKANGGVVIATGGFEWDPELVTTFLRGPMRGPSSPPYNTGDGLRMAMSLGSALGSMGEAWWIPILQIPGDTMNGKPRSRSVRMERARPGSIMVNSDGARFVNEAGDYHSMGGAFHHLDPNRGYVNDPAWLICDSRHLRRYGFLGISEGDEIPEWFHSSPDLRTLAESIGADGDRLVATVDRWNRSVADGADPEFGRGISLHDGLWGDAEAETAVGRTLGPIDEPPFFGVRLTVGANGTKGGPKTDRRARVQHVTGGDIPGLYAAGNAMAGITGRVYGGAGGTLAPGMTWGFLAGRDAVGP